MTQFKDRENAFEKKYAHEEELDFAVEARCCKIFGVWMGGQLGLSGAEADAYAMEVVESNLDEPGFEDVMRKVNADIEEKGLEIAEETLRLELDKALIEAKKQLADS